MFRDGMDKRTGLVALGATALTGFVSAWFFKMPSLAGVALAPLGVALYRLDATAARAREAEFQAQLIRHDARNAIAERDAQIEIARRAMVSTLSAELVTPLDDVLAAQRRLTHELVDQPEAQKQSKALIAALRSYRRIIMSNVAIAGARAGVDEDLTPIQVRPFLRQRARAWQALLTKRGTAFELVIAPGVCEGVLFDRVALENCLDNLVAGISQRLTGGSVFIHVAPETHGFMITIADSGPALTPDEHETLSNSCSGAMPAQLGLPLARSLARQLGGELAVTSRDQKGCEFRLTLNGSVYAVPGGRNLIAPDDDTIIIYSEPSEIFGSQINIAPTASGTKPASDSLIDISPEVLDIMEALHSSTPESSTRPLPTLKLLFAEDVIVNQHLLTVQAEALGAEVTCVGTAEELIKIHEATPFPIIIMDIHMPGMGGIAGIRALREFDRHTPIIAFTADGVAVTHDEAKKAGADIVLTKPLSGRELEKALNYCRNLKRAA